uniref:Uncharacterized protein n=1 Tax=Arundo donax TaxID=35708 RepID=A0A0A9BZP7_ARUDO
MLRLLLPPGVLARRRHVRPRPAGPS